VRRSLEVVFRILSIDTEYGTTFELSSFEGAHERIDWPLRGSFGVLCARGQQVVTQSWLSRLSKRAGGSQSAPRGGVESSQTQGLSLYPVSCKN
jgi:hypothetical protein